MPPFGDSGGVVSAMETLLAPVRNVRNCLFSALICMVLFSHRFTRIPRRTFARPGTPVCCGRVLHTTGNERQGASHDRTEGDPWHLPTEFRSRSCERRTKRRQCAN